MSNAVFYSSAEASTHKQMLMFFPTQLGMLSLRLTSDYAEHFSFLEH